MTGFRVQIKPGSIKFKTDATGKTKIEPVPAYASVSDKIKRQNSKRVKVKRK